MQWRRTSLRLYAGHIVLVTCNDKERIMKAISFDTIKRNLIEKSIILERLFVVGTFVRPFLVLYYYQPYLHKEEMQGGWEPE